MGSSSPGTPDPRSRSIRNTPGSRRHGWAAAHPRSDKVPWIASFQAAHDKPWVVSLLSASRGPERRGAHASQNYPSTSRRPRTLSTEFTSNAATESGSGRPTPARPSHGGAHAPWQGTGGEPPVLAETTLFFVSYNAHSRRVLPPFRSMRSRADRPLRLEFRPPLDYFSPCCSWAPKPPGRTLAACGGTFPLGGVPKVDEAASGGVGSGHKDG